MDIASFVEDFDPRFKLFHELMQKKVRDILLVSSLYDACIMEEDCRLAERINNEYRGLNLSKPPRLTWVSSAEEALQVFERQEFDMVITMPRLADMNPSALGLEFKKRNPDIPVIMLTHRAMAPDRTSEFRRLNGIDRTFVWTGNTDLLLSMIKSVEDRFNVEYDTQRAGVRVILLVEDSPTYLSVLLPVLYREVVAQTQAIMEEKLNEEDRLLTMRARAKILVAESYEEAMEVVERFKPYLLGVISDTRFPKAGRLQDLAGLDLLSWIRREIFDIPMLLTSSEPANRERADIVSAAFMDKNSTSLQTELRAFLKVYLGFGDFLFRMPDSSVVGRATSVRGLEKALQEVPEASIVYHAQRNDFSRWLYARAETVLANRMRPMTLDDFHEDVRLIREFLVSILSARRKQRQKGVVADFDPADFDPDTDFFKIGRGSLGGKARGLAFLTTMLQLNPNLHNKYPLVDIVVPHTLVITTEYFDIFVESNNLRSIPSGNMSDREIAERFKAAEMPAGLAESLRLFLSQVRYPLAVRSSGLLEDSQFQAYAGLYRTYMIPNNDPDLEVRLHHLLEAIKLVYASTYYRGPRAFAHRVGQRSEEEKMAAIVQELVGGGHNGFFYPDLSGVAQSHNYYPFARMKPEDGIASIAFGLGRTVVEGSQALRFSPRFPQLLPQFSTVEDILKNAQRTFYALNLDGCPVSLDDQEESCLERRDVDEAEGEEPLMRLASTYMPEEHRIRDTTALPGRRLVTFAPILKLKTFPLAGLLGDVLALINEGMGCPVEIEFSARLPESPDDRAQFAFLQVRPMSARAEAMEVEIEEADLERAVCRSNGALGNCWRRDMADVVFVRPRTFDKTRTVQIAREIGKFNARLLAENRPYLLIGPGRWGSADRFLGIPVAWADISGVGAIVETTAPDLKAEPSQGSHFFPQRDHAGHQLSDGAGWRRGLDRLGLAGRAGCLPGVGVRDLGPHARAPGAQGRRPLLTRRDPALGPSAGRRGMRRPARMHACRKASVLR